MTDRPEEIKRLTTPYLSELDTLRQLKHDYSVKIQDQAIRLDECRQLTHDYAAKIQDQAIRLDECRILYEDALKELALQATDHGIMYSSVVKERDEARGKVANQGEMEMRFSNLCLKLTKERDEALAEVQRLKGRLAAKDMLRSLYPGPGGAHGGGE